MVAVRPLLKRGMLVAAANWQLTIIQATADSLFKLLIAVPTVGGVVFMALVIGAEPERLLRLDARDLLATVVAALLSQPLVLAAFALALAVVVGGGSAFMFLVKGGTIATLVAGERRPPVPPDPHDHPHPPLAQVAAVASFGVDRYFADCHRFFPRYLRLGVLLLAVYTVSAGAFLAAGLAGAGRGGWAVGASLSTLFIAWITLVNLLYLLAQIAIVAEDCPVHEGLARVWGLVRAEWAPVGAIFLLVLGIVAAGTVASILAMGALSLVGFIPLLGLAVLPLQLAAWLFRALVFQFIDLSAVGAYANRIDALRASRVPAAGAFGAAGQVTPGTP